MLRIIWLLGFLSFPSLPVLAAERFPSTIQGEADFAEGDVVHSRHDAVEDALKKAVTEALKTEAGSSVLDDDPTKVKVKFINPYKDFIVRSGVLGESKVGLRFTVTVGYELDLQKLRARIAGAKFSAVEPKPRIALLWVVEQKGTVNEDLPGKTELAGGYEAASWMSPVTAPDAVSLLQSQFNNNGFNVVQLPEDVRKWIPSALGKNTVHQQFLGELSRKLEVRTLVFVRFVRRDVPTPRAARFAISRMNHVAFVYDAVKGEIAGKPIASPQIEVVGASAESANLNDWMNRLLSRLVSAQEKDTLFTVTGISSVSQYEQVLAALRKNPDLKDVTPRRISASQVQFRLSGSRPLPAWTELLKTALPEAEVSSVDGAIEAKITPAAKK